MTPHTLHATAVRRVAATLRRKGALVRIQPASSAVSLIVDGTFVGVRVATPHRLPHTVTVRGKRYRYTYTRLIWNLHTHARRCEGVAVWVLVAPGRVYVVPAHAVRGKTVTLHLGRKRSRAAVVAYRDEWGVLVPEGRRRFVERRAA